MIHTIQALTIDQKLTVIQENYYLTGGVRKLWVPKKGDYYTTPRKDLELYRIIEEDDTYYYTVYCQGLKLDNISKWKKEEFLTEGFGTSRIHVSNWIIGL